MKCGSCDNAAMPSARYCIPCLVAAGRRAPFNMSASDVLAMIRRTSEHDE